MAIPKKADRNPGKEAGKEVDKAAEASNKSDLAGKAQKIFFL